MSPILGLLSTPRPNAAATAWNPFSLTSAKKRSCLSASRSLLRRISCMTPCAWTQSGHSESWSPKHLQNNRKEMDETGNGFRYKGKVLTDRWWKLCLHMKWTLGRSSGPPHCEHCVAWNRRGWSISESSSTCLSLVAVSSRYDVVSCSS